MPLTELIIWMVALLVLVISGLRWSYHMWRRIFYVMIQVNPTCHTIICQEIQNKYVWKDARTTELTENGTHLNFKISNGTFQLRQGSQRLEIELIQRPDQIRLWIWRGQSNLPRSLESPREVETFFRDFWTSPIITQN